MPKKLTLFYPFCVRGCVASHVESEPPGTQLLRQGEMQLFICHCKPHKKASKHTIARWIKTVMAKAGVDTNVFRPHSTRGAAVSKANTAAVPITEILSSAGWSSARTFATYYNKPLYTTRKQFVNAVLRIDER